MEDQHEPSRDSLALARKHVRALTEGGVSRRALLRALMEQEEAAAAAGNDHVAPLPEASSEPKLKKSRSSTLSRMASLSQKASSHWSVSTTTANGGATNGPTPTVAIVTCEDDGRPGSSDQLSTSTGKSGSRASYLSTHTTATTLSSRSSTLTQFPGTELAGNRPASASTRAYWCTSCDTEFKRKFDWKRHEDEFHERYKKYPCPDCNRVFWGANTFNQHHKTRHNCKTCPHADKVIKYTRKKRAWACGFCAAFLPSMDRYIDHIGLHYESGRTKAHWYHSNVIYGLLHQPGVNAAWKNIIGSRFSHIPKDQQPRYGWDAKTTGRKQGFLENETSGNLQDLLEFFNPTQDDAVKIARIAFDLAELIAVNQAASERGSIEVPDKVPQPPPREVSSSSSMTIKREKTTSSKRKPSPPHLEVVPPPPPPVAPAKDRRITQWPGFQQGGELMVADSDVQMVDYDATAVPQPLFAGSLSPPPMQARPQQQQQQQHHQQHQPQPFLPSQHHHHQQQQHQAPGLAMSPASDQPTYLTPTTPLSQASSTPFNGMPRDTVADLLSDYMTPEQMHQAQAAAPPPPPPQLAQFANFQDWNSMCSTMVDDIGSPRGPPLPPAPHERQQMVRRSDVWAGPESMYLDGVQACDILSPGPPPPPLPVTMEDTRRSDVWATRGGVDYEGMGYEDEIAPGPAATNWL